MTYASSVHLIKSELTILDGTRTLEPPTFLQIDNYIKIQHDNKDTIGLAFI